MGMCVSGPRLRAGACNARVNSATKLRATKLDGDHMRTDLHCKSVTRVRVI